MRDHFTAVALVRDAVIAGNVDLAQWNATWIAEREPEPDVATWNPFVGQLRQHATKVTEANDLAAAATATSQIALECGRCHQAHGASPTFVDADGRVAASGRRPHMLEHQWAAERMWEGLIGPSESRWTIGTAELAKAPLGQDEIVANASVTQAIARLATDVHALAAEGSKATTWDERGAIYGRMLATCAACHAQIPPTP